jgi:predicted MFS family arabinose efflux permease
VAAIGGEALLPARLSNRQRGVGGALTCAFALVMLVFMPMSPSWIVPMLAMAGLGLGVFVPANNAVIMRTAGPGSASVLGGLVNMARGIGTTLGIALMTVCLHLAGAGQAGRPDAAAALAVLAAAAAAAALIAATIRPLGAVPGQAHETGPTGAFG